ncbi:MAG: hypothetical protein WAV28_09590 [Sedimentisphaerales bacterium]
MLKLLKHLNDNHWYIIGGILITALLFWMYGCESQVSSMLDKDRLVNRAELQAEADYLVAQFKAKTEKLDSQDQLKMLLLEQAQIFGQTGTFNPAGLLNLAVSVGAISFGLDRNRKYKSSLSAKNNT